MEQEEEEVQRPEGGATAVIAAAVGTAVAEGTAGAAALADAVTAAAVAVAGVNRAQRAAGLVLDLL